MLQIISGKFFEGDERHQSDGYGILYSNYSWIASIDTSVISLSPVAFKRDSYVVKYRNQIEKAQNSVLVRVGDDVIVEQFQNLCTFGFQAIFDTEKQVIERLCKGEPGERSTVVPSKVLPRYFNPVIYGKLSEVELFTKLIEKIISLPRRDYNRITRCMSAFSSSLKILDYNFDLAYSMLIYCLETLSQGYNPQPQWVNYEKHSQVDEALQSVDETVVDNVRRIILEERQLKLQERFLRFIMDNTTISFFAEESTSVKSPIRRSEFEQALISAYAMRSSYAHELEPVLAHLKAGFVEGDVYHHDNTPYLTYSGLLRLTRHVMLNYVFSQGSIANEQYDWMNDLPHILQMKMDTRYWLSNTLTFHEKQAKMRLSGFLSELERSIIDKRPLTECKNLMELYVSKIQNVEKRYKLPMVVHYCLYRSFSPRDEMPYRPKLEKYIHSEKLLETCEIENLIFCALTNQGWVWPVKNCEARYLKYNKKKHEEDALVLPQLFEVIVLIMLANCHYEQGYYENYPEWITLAYCEAAGNNKLQSFIRDRWANGEIIDISELFAHFRS